MENTKETYYVSYRGYIHLNVPIEAANEDEAYKIAQTMPNTPTKGQEFIITTSDMDFEIEYDYFARASEITKHNVPAKFETAILTAALTQPEARNERNKQLKIAQLTSQIESAQAQLLTATKGITDQIEKLSVELEQLK